MSYFQRRHYEALASALRRAGAHRPPSERGTQILDNLVRVLAHDNHRFDEARFREAVGWE